MVVIEKFLLLIESSNCSCKDVCVSKTKPEVLITDTYCF